MSQYRKKPVVIEAEQWFPGKVIEGVVMVPVQVHYSCNREYCYLSVPGATLPRFWMGMEKIPGPMTEAEQKQHNIFTPGTLEIRKPDSGEVYRRKLLDFTFFEVKSGDTEDIDLESDIAQDYWRLMDWPERIPVARGYIQTLEGRMEVSPGDWVITGVKGERYPCKPDIFEATYEAV